ncbi:hypothetical protein ACTMTJ_35155 [Phytohabitans sp. LJ34]|uniref:hypothetical protein n=1 Tax=Phytohabitans sp. LJ34 TaxID=3452217 RepID=UPI003F89EC19
MAEAERPPAEGDGVTPIADLTAHSLDDVLGSGESALTSSMRRLVEDMRQSGEHYAAHGSTT